MFHGQIKKVGSNSCLCFTAVMQGSFVYIGKGTHYSIFICNLSDKEVSKSALLQFFQLILR